MKIIKIGAIWCPGCLVIKKSIEKIKSNYPEIDLKELDLDFDEEEVKQYNVGDVLPVLIFYKDNEEYTRLIGESKYEDMERVIKEINEK